MYPILINWQGIVLPAWHVFFLLAALVALLILLKLRNQSNAFAHNDMINLYLICYFCGYFGARILSIVIEEPYAGLENFFASLLKPGALTLYGGVILASICALIYIRCKKLDAFVLLDHFVIAFLAALAIGRIGCFLNGDDYGIVVSENNFFGIVFPNLKDNQPRYPTQLFETFFCLLLFFGSYFFFIRRRERMPSGMVGLAGMGAYTIFRFFNEYLRGDYRGWVIVEKLSTSQFLSLSVLLLTLCFFILRWQKGRINSPSDPIQPSST